MDRLSITPDQKKRLEKAARKAHENYVASATPKDPSFKKWEDLDETLKLSNYHQVAYWEQLVKAHGLHIRPLTEEAKTHQPIQMEEILGNQGIKKLAQMEHGRWNIERLAHGWKFDPQKDVVRKLSPYLVPWTDLDPGIQKYDIDAVKGLPSKLREVGLEIEDFRMTGTLKK